MPCYDETNVGRYLQTAKKFQADALAEFYDARANGSKDTKIRQAAEKGWGAVVQATNHLLEKKNVKVPKGTQRREERLIEVEARDQRIREAEIPDKYHAFMQTLHSECFYDGTYSIKVVERYLRRVGEFIRLIESI